jgi:hypothetical protein
MHTDEYEGPYMKSGVPLAFSNAKKFCAAMLPVRPESMAFTASDLSHPSRFPNAGTYLPFRSLTARVWRVRVR